MSALGAFGRSRARRVEGGTTNVTFADVAGIDEAKSELTEVVDFLKNPDRYRARRPDPARRAALGPARHRQDAAGARRRRRGERAVLLGLGVGVRRGDRRHRRLARARPLQAGQGVLAGDHLHRRARRDRPLAHRRASPFGGGNDEREQTLNQILTEMDGFESNVAVIVLGATNRPEILDQALLRPGRFDRRVAVPPPDKDGRRQILEVHTRSMPLGRRRRPRLARRQHARHGRRRPGQPRQRGRAARRPPRPRAGPARGLHRRAGEDHPRRAARDGALRRGPPRAPPTTSPATRSSACSRRAPTRCARSRSSRAGWRSA